MTQAKERKVMTMGKLAEISADYKVELQAKVRQMKAVGYEFILCWNFQKDALKAWEKVQSFDSADCPTEEYSRLVDLTKQAIRGLYTKEEFGNEYILVALNRGFTTVANKRVYPTEAAKDALGFIGLVPVKNKIKAMHFTTRQADKEDIVNYRFAEPHEVVAFL